MSRVYMTKYRGYWIERGHTGKYIILKQHDDYIEDTMYSMRTLDDTKQLIDKLIEKGVL